MDLLKICREIIKYDEQGYYKHLKDTYLGFYSPDICRALVDAMEEIESERTPKSDDISDRMFAFGVRFALVVLREHLEGKNDTEL